LKNTRAAPFGGAKRLAMRIYSRVSCAFYSAHRRASPLRASLRLFEIVPDGFIAVFGLARHPPERFSTNG
jgi:hypothetical protein